jgi:hypothetical protein
MAGCATRLVLVTSATGNPPQEATIVDDAVSHTHGWSVLARLNNPIVHDVVDDGAVRADCRE